MIGSSWCRRNIQKQKTKTKLFFLQNETAQAHITLRIYDALFEQI